MTQLENSADLRSDAEAENTESEGEFSPGFTVTGADLSSEDLTALTMVLAQLAAVTAEDDDTGGAGPQDRHQQRKIRLHRDHGGLWGRPGPRSWIHTVRGH